MIYMNPLVSIIVPCYNGEKYIDRCFESIKAQDYSPVELVVVDDGSTDSSKRKILEWKDKLSEDEIHIEYIHQDNQGVGGAINTGLKAVTGKYLSLLDVDDEYLPDCIKECVEYLERNSEDDIVRTNGYIVGTAYKYLFVNEQNEKEVEDVFLALLRGETNNWAGSYMVRTEPLFRFYPDREIYITRYGQNLQIMLPLLYKKQCNFIDHPHMNYNRQNESLSHTQDTLAKEKKAIENAYGYRDIRLHMIDLIVKDNIERNYYINHINDAFWLRMMNIAMENNDKKLMKESYKEKKSHYIVSIDDTIMYYEIICPPLAIGFRVWRKLKKVLWK